MKAMLSQLSAGAWDLARKPLLLLEKDITVEGHGDLSGKDPAL